NCADNLQYVSDAEYVALLNSGKNDKLNGFVQMKDPYSNYYIANDGRVYSTVSDLFMKCTQKGVYNFVCLRGNKEICPMICNLVAEYFLPKVDGKERIWHKNEDFIDD